jgi:hypothetical protein
MIPNHNKNIKTDSDIQKRKEMRKILEDVKNYTPLSEDQLLLLETVDIKQMIEIIKMQNNCLGTLSALMT